MYTQEELNKLIQVVEKEFSELLTKSEESGVDGMELAKAEPAEEPKEDEKEESQEAPEQEAPAAEAPEAEAKEEPSEEQKDPELKEEIQAPKSDEGHGYDEEDLKHMQEMYGSMSRAELMAHHDAVKQCLDAQSMEKCGEMAPAAAAKEAPAAEAMAKSEDTTDLLKSELETEKAKNEELKKNLDAVSEFLGKLLTKKAPVAKAITSIETIAKSESQEEEKVLSKSEIDSILYKKSSDPSLAKADRELINAFYLNKGSINSITHLLK